MTGRPPWWSPEATELVNAPFDPREMLHRLERLRARYRILIEAAAFEDEDAAARLLATAAREHPASIAEARASANDALEARLASCEAEIDRLTTAPELPPPRERADRREALARADLVWLLVELARAKRTREGPLAAIASAIPPGGLLDAACALAGARHGMLPDAVRALIGLRCERPCAPRSGPAAVTQSRGPNSAPDDGARSRGLNSAPDDRPRSRRLSSAPDDGARSREPDSAPDDGARSGGRISQPAGASHDTGGER